MLVEPFVASFETYAVAFRFQEASFVLAGTFNIYIIRPDWLGEVGLLTSKSEVRIESHLSQPGFRLSSPGLGARWVVQPTRIVLETERSDQDCGQIADRLLEVLPWTPMTALGANFTYRGSSSDVTGWDAKTQFPQPRVPSETTLKQRSWHVAMQCGDQTFNLQMSEAEGAVDIRVNVHTELTAKKSDFARQVARDFMKHREVAESYIRELFEAEIAHADDNV